MTSKHWKWVLRSDFRHADFCHWQNVLKQEKDPDWCLTPTKAWKHNHCRFTGLLLCIKTSLNYLLWQPVDVVYLPPLQALLPSMCQVSCGTFSPVTWPQKDSAHQQLLQTFYSSVFISERKRIQHLSTQTSNNNQQNLWRTSLLLSEELAKASGRPMLAISWASPSNISSSASSSSSSSVGYLKKNHHSSSLSRTNRGINNTFWA